MAFIRVHPNVNYQWTLPGHLRIEGKIQGSPRKMFTYVTFLFVTSIEGMSLLRERNTFSGSRNPALTSIQETF